MILGVALIVLSGFGLVLVAIAIVTAIVMRFRDDSHNYNFAATLPINEDFRFAEMNRVFKAQQEFLRDVLEENKRLTALVGRMTESGKLQRTEQFKKATAVFDPLRSKSDDH